jgi:hypothetical protein
VYYSDYFDYQAWWADASHQLAHFFKLAGPAEITIMAGNVKAVGLVFMREFQTG